MINKIYITYPEAKAKALTMSYDDGKQEDLRLIDIFDANGIKCTFNLNYGLMDNTLYEDAHPRVGKEKVRETYKNHEVATHCCSHPTIERCPLTEVAFEIMEDRKGLESLIGKPVRGHAYPNGSYSSEIKTLFKQLGIAYARTVNAVPGFGLPSDPLEWNPTAHHSDPELMNKAEYFVNFKKKQYLKLMYIWGHSYEFAMQNNWEVIERFCEYMGGRADIWYCTNIQFIDYMDAAKRLQFAADNSFVFNPSAMTVCLEVNGSYVEVGAGELKNF